MKTVKLVTKSLRWTSEMTQQVKALIPIGLMTSLIPENQPLNFVCWTS